MSRFKETNKDVKDDKIISLKSSEVEMKIHRRQNWSTESWAIKGRFMCGSANP